MTSDLKIAAYLRELADEEKWEARAISLRQCANECERQAERIEQLEAAMDKLARLGNEPHYGNSDGNTIARKALEDE